MDSTTTQAGSSTNVDFDPDALRDKYRAERDKRAPRRRQRAVPRGRRRVRALRRRPVRRADRAGAAVRRGRGAHHRRRLRRSARRRPAARGRHRRHPRRREGRRLRRHLVLEPLSRARPATSSRTSTSRCSRRSATSPRRSTPRRPRSSRTARRSASTSTCTATPASRPRSRRCAGTTATTRWIVSTNRGDEMRARYVCMASGPLHRPKLPGIPGIESFQGHTFHTSRWDYDYTGGDSDGNLTGLADKRVGIIGTGATAVQCVPHLGAGGQGAVRVPAHAVVDRRARQPPDRSRVGEQPRRGLAGTADGELQQPRLRHPRVGGPRQRRLDRHHRQPADPAAHRVRAT